MSEKIEVTLFTARPGLVIGKKAKKAFENLKRVKHKRIQKTLEDYSNLLKFNESKILKSKIFKKTNIRNVNNVYKINILDDCFKVSDVLNVKKFVKDFFKLLSKISINKIIENKK